MQNPEKIHVDFPGPMAKFQACKAKFWSFFNNITRFLHQVLISLCRRLIVRLFHDYLFYKPAACPGNIHLVNSRLDIAQADRLPGSTCSYLQTTLVHGLAYFIGY